jgi:predicted nucleotidyltransferase
MNQHTLIDRVTAALADDQRIRGLFLSGSFGRGSADAYSDVDFWAVVARPDQEAVATDWRKLLEKIVPIVYFNRLPWALVLNAITDGWLRCDLDIGAPDQLGGRTQDRLKPLLDRDGIHASLPASLLARDIDPGRLQAVVNEFIRVLGLLPVALGRGEIELMVTGSGLLRRSLTDLLILEVNLPDPGGMLHLSRVLDADRMAILAALPLPVLSADSAIAVNLALARVFIPRARMLYAQLDLGWPEAFEAATRRHLAQALPAPYRPDW